MPSRNDSGHGAGCPGERRSSGNPEGDPEIGGSQERPPAEESSTGEPAEGSRDELPSFEEPTFEEPTFEELSFEELSFEEIVGTYQNELFGTALRILGDRALAEDALQDTFMKAYRALPSLKPKSNVRAWLYRILVNTTYDLLDRQKTHAKAMDTLTAEYEAELRRERVGVEERRDQLRKEVERAIRGLPTKYRDALILRTIQDLPYAEVAEALEIPETTARSLVHRGKSLLLPKLTELMRPEG